MPRASLDHREDFCAVHPSVGQVARAAEASEEGSALPGADSCRGDVGVEVLLGLVVCWNVVELSALLVEAEPESLALLEVVVHVHADDGTHAGEAVDHDADE